MKTLIDFVLHLEEHLDALIQWCGPFWVYLVLFGIIFAETGLVIMPFLPGDSLLFALGALAANGTLDLTTLLITLCIAAVLGDTINYSLGAQLGPRLFRGEKIWLLNPKHLERTHEFFEKYGGKTIIIARFVPIVRTFAPFVAGMGRMTYARFMAFNVIGGLVWVVGFLILGYAFGNVPIVKKNFTAVILGIIVVSIVPAIVEFVLERRRLKKAAAAAASASPIAHSTTGSAETSAPVGE